MAEVKFEHVRKQFGQVVAIEDLDLAIRSGEFISLLGPSGCGKTTTLRMLAGLDQPTSGTISVGDRVVNDLPPGKRDIAMVFQSYALYPHMTVAQNIEYPLKKRGVPARRAPAAGAAHRAGLLQIDALLDAQATAALGRPAAARRARPRPGARSGRLPARRAAVEPGRQAARAYARRADRAAPAHRQDDDLRDARPARGDDHVDRIAVHGRRHAAAMRHAATDLPPPGQRLRRRLHRHAGDELPAGADAARTARICASTRNGCR